MTLNVVNSIIKLVCWMVRIRVFREEDAATLEAIYREAFQDEIKRGMEIVTAREFIEFSKRPEVKIFVAELDDQVVGYVMISERRGLPLRVNTIAVKKEFRRRGFGKKLLKKSVEYAKSTGKGKIVLFTRPWNKPMRKICLELGFIPEAYLRKDFFNEDLIRYSFFL